MPLSARFSTASSKDLAVWLVEAKYFWLGLFVIVAAGCIALRPGVSEPLIRLTGLVLQVSGIGTVVWGISETRTLFGHPSFYEVAIAWLRRCPFFRRSVQLSGTAMSTSTSFTGGGAYGAVGTPPNSSLEQRIEALEKNLPIIHSRITAVKVEANAKVQAVRDALAAESHGRQSEDAALASRLEASATGGVCISAIGAAWLFVGVIFSTAGVELQAWLR